MDSSVLQPPSSVPRRKTIQMLGFVAACWWGLTQAAFASQKDTAPQVISTADIIQQVRQATAALNDVARTGAGKTQADQLFDLYSADFVYVHDKYGGVYSREQLYRNTLRMIARGGDHSTTDRYQLLQILPGESAAAVLRLTRDGQQHLALFEFKQGKISKITEYW